MVGPRARGVWPALRPGLRPGSPEMPTTEGEKILLAGTAPDPLVAGAAKVLADPERTYVDPRGFRHASVRPKIPEGSVENFVASLSHRGSTRRSPGPATAGN